MPDFTSTILLVGAGKMGSALLDGWLRAGIDPQNITILDPAAENRPGVRIYPFFRTLPGDFRADTVLLAVKPQSMDEVLEALPAFEKNSEPLFISIAAGKTLPYFAQKLGAAASVIRAMPNTPALIGRGISVLCPNAEVSPEQKQTAETLLRATGSVVWLKDESKMDAVTALSGSGPAYVFYFLEALVAAGEKLGLDGALAKRLAIETVEGSAALAAQTGELLEQLRINVTSPGGTTEAALKIAMEDDTFRTLIEAMLSAAAVRSRQLSS